MVPPTTSSLSEFPQKICLGFEPGSGRSSPGILSGHAPHEYRPRRPLRLPPNLRGEEPADLSRQLQTRRHRSASGATQARLAGPDWPRFRRSDRALRTPRALPQTRAHAPRSAETARRCFAMGRVPLASRSTGRMIPDMRILVVEDDSKIASFVVKGLRQSGFAVDHCADGETGLDHALTIDYDALVLDLMLPGVDGLTLLQRVRARGRKTPVIILSARASVDDRVRGLQAGSDDYLTKPFAFSELLARLQALLRRTSRTETEPTRLVVGELTLDLLTREVSRSGVAVELQPREFALLEYLMRNAGRVVTKTLILEHVWDYSFDPQTNVVDVLVHRLRSKVDPEHRLIQTLRGVGYVLKPA